VPFGGLFEIVVADFHIAAARANLTAAAAAMEAAVAVAAVLMAVPDCLFAVWSLDELPVFFLLVLRFSLDKVCGPSSVSRGNVHCKSLKKAV
jgi:hypothetical protein